MFLDRWDAGRQLARRLIKFQAQNPFVFAIPRGGVVVAEEIAKPLKAPLDLIIPRKIGSPANREMAIGAVTQDGSVMLDQSILAYMGIEEKDLSPQIEAEKKEINRRMTLYRGTPEPPKVEGKTIILVDDGIATGYTVLAAIKSLRKLNPQKLILAVPVVPGDSADKFAREADEFVCLEAPEIFYAVGQFYHNFDQTTDQEVINILQGNVQIVNLPK